MRKNNEIGDIFTKQNKTRNNELQENEGKVISRSITKQSTLHSN